MVKADVPKVLLVPLELVSLARVYGNPLKLLPFFSLHSLHVILLHHKLKELFILNVLFYIDRHSTNIIQYPMFRYG